MSDFSDAIFYPLMLSFILMEYITCVAWLIIGGFFLRFGALQRPK